MQWIGAFFLGIGACYDVKNQKIPVTLLGVFLTIAVMVNLAFPYQSLKSILLGAGVGALFLIVGAFTKEAIGYGDGLGIMIVGILEGCRSLLFILIIAFCLSSIWGLWKLLVLRTNKDETMPFYPCLFLASIGGLLL